MRRLSLSLAMIAGLSSCVFAADPSFAIHSHDRVVFYGDSITDNGWWTYYVAMDILCRYPSMDVYYMNAGVGGDRVTGGWAGPIDTRLPRDLFSRKPTVITCMLGMNDAGYQPFNQGLFDTYKKGYTHIMEEIGKNAPKAQVWLIQPSPFDDVTRKPGWDPGYNSVLETYAGFVGDLASQFHAHLLDENAPMNALLKSADAIDPSMAQKLLPDRVHPSPTADYVMAESVLKAWGMSPVVSSTTIDWTTGMADTEGSKVSGWNNGSFTLLEKALPMPMNRADAATAFVMKASDYDAALNQEILKVTNMPAGQYTLAIDGKSVGTFSSDDFSSGVNLALLNTPMEAQANAAAAEMFKELQLRYNTWRNIQYTLGDESSAAVKAAEEGSEKLAEAIDAHAHKLAMPVAHSFTITPA